MKQPVFLSLIILLRNFDNLLSITKSSASTDPYGYYYFFYDLEVKRKSCFSSVEEFNAVINHVTNLKQNILHLQ